MADMYDRSYISGYFDRFADGEWERLASTPGGRASLALHTAMLQEYVRPGDRVLEIGAGPGRFTIELAKLGARIVVGDISAVQLRLNEEKVREAGYDGAVEERLVLDMLDLERFAEAGFDVVVAYGGPVSYVMERAGDALDQMRRVVRPGGHIAMSVMSLVGGTRALLEAIVMVLKEHGSEIVERVQVTGDLDGSISNGHRCHMFRFDELRSLIEAHALEIVAASAANFLSLNNAAAMEQIERDPDLWRRFIAWELRYCREPGAIDGGTHIITVARRPA